MRTGASRGGFHRLRLRFPEAPPAGLRREDISTELILIRRDDSRPKITINVPWYGGGMSFGSTNIRPLLGKARVAKAFHGFTCTGEGGYPERFTPYKDHVITQVATGLFGVREETIQRARIIEFKYAQGAKPGLGGHLLGDTKVLPSAPMNFRSTQAVNSPMTTPARKNGSSGHTSRFQDNRPRFHQKTTSNAAGRVAITPLDSKPNTNSSKAAT